MAAASVIRYWAAGDRFPRIGRDLGSDPAVMTAGNTVADAVVVLVAVPPAGVSSPHSPHVVWPVYTGAPGESFDPLDKITVFHTSGDAVRIRSGAAGPLAWTFHYVLQEPAARTI